MEVPNFFSGLENILSFDFDGLKNLLNTDIDNTYFIENLSLDNNLVSDYFKSIIMGHNHIFISKLLQTYGESSNLCLPLFNQWNDSPSIDLMANIFILLGRLASSIGVTSSIFAVLARSNAAD